MRVRGWPLQWLAVQLGTVAVGLPARFATATLLAQHLPFLALAGALPARQPRSPGPCLPGVAWPVVPRPGPGAFRASSSGLSGTSADVRPSPTLARDQQPGPTQPGVVRDGDGDGRNVGQPVGQPGASNVAAASVGSTRRSAVLGPCRAGPGGPTVCGGRPGTRPGTSRRRAAGRA